MRRSVALAIVALAASLGLAQLGGEQPTNAPGTQPNQVYRAFEPDSWWNTPLPSDAPLDPAGRDILRYLRTAPENGHGCLRLAGAADEWGQPIYWAKPSDPTYRVTGVEAVHLPELRDLRIPRGARPAANSDRAMIIYDLDKGYVVALTGAQHDVADDTWTATGATVTYLDSNGLNVKTGKSDDPRNRGTHRGNNGATMAVRWDEVNAGAIRHVLKVSAGPEVSNRYVFPMTGSDGPYLGNDPAVPPQGLRLRIKPSVDLDEMELSHEALIIARALQRYGFYIGDSGGSTSLKLEDTQTSGRGDLWTLSPQALCVLPFTPAYWDVVAEGYDPTR